MEGSSEDGTQTPKLFVDIDEAMQPRYCSDEVEDIKRMLTLTEISIDSILRRRKEERYARCKPSNRMCLSSKHGSAERDRGLKFTSQEGKVYTLESLLTDLDTLLILLEVDGLCTRINLETTQFLEQDVSEIESVAVKLSEMHLKVPANIAEIGRNADSVLPFLEDPSTALKYRDEVTWKTFWAVDELLCIAEHIKSTIDASLERLKFAVEYRRLLKSMRHYLVRSKKYPHESLRIKYVFEDMAKSKKDQARMGIEVHETATRIAKTLVGIAAQISGQVLQGTDADRKLSATLLEKHNTEMKSTTLAETNFSGAANSVRGVRTQLPDTAEGTAVTGLKGSIRTTAEYAQDVAEARDSAHETITFENEGDDNGEIAPKNECEGIEPTVLEGGEVDGKETDKKVTIKDLKNHADGTVLKD
ncbi:uncharacterized protein LOC110837179 [Zootermopsis nevadensis]|uniref:Uncharacterized protein n=1 Tax=Zootermopsis nevadensis TaxID=136037 RepID=A0A067R192_ZOONE|nr:uncharacterized protein LOC110837179 [Zootermopsis nevadensis]KDR11336.1 hypothetical protein L798_14878 [Zootermopsis nevadensis]